VQLQNRISTGDVKLLYCTINGNIKSKADLVQPQKSLWETGSIKVNVNFTLERSTKAQKERRLIALLFL